MADEFDEPGERTQVILRRDQRRRLRSEARARRTSVSSLIREAVDHRFGRGSTREEKRAALERIRKRRVELPPPEELNEIIEGRFDDKLPLAG